MEGSYADAVGQPFSSSGQMPRSTLGQNQNRDPDDALPAKPSLQTGNLRDREAAADEDTQVGAEVEADNSQRADTEEKR